jgi:hypothetical protein
MRSPAMVINISPASLPWHTSRSLPARGRASSRPRGRGGGRQQGDGDGGHAATVTEASASDVGRPADRMAG